MALLNSYYFGANVYGYLEASAKSLFNYLKIEKN